MYELIIKEKELLDEESYEFIHTKRYKIVIEHSLVSISKWEAFYEESFFEVKAISDMDRNKFLKYVKFMTITQNIDDAVYTYDGIFEDVFVHENPHLFVFDGTYTIPE